MKRTVALSIAMLLLACLVPVAWADDAAVHRFLGGWLNDDYSMTIRLEDDELFCVVSQTDEASGDIVYWEYAPCVYRVEDDSLSCPTCVRYRERIDFETFEIIQEDWSLIDLEPTRFAFEGDEDTLVGFELHDINGPVVFRRTADGEAFGTSH